MRKVIVILSIYSVVLILYSVYTLVKISGKTLVVSPQFILINSIFLSPILVLAVVNIFYIKNQNKNL